MSYRKWKDAHPWLSFWLDIKTMFCNIMRDIRISWCEDKDEESSDGV